MPVDTTATSVYASQSVFTDPGAFGRQLDEVPDDLQSIKDAANRLVFHYRADGDWAEHGIAPERIREIDTRYAERMFRRLFELNDQPLTEARQPAQRLVGCCRDFTVFFLSIARHKGIPARSRVGFATYLMPGWSLDHVVAEVWDSDEQRWRLVDAELDAGHVDPTDGVAIDPLDVPRNRFLTGDRAWTACRSDEADPETFVVAPDLDIPLTRGWPYLAHNLIHDLAALNLTEMLLWDVWGMMGRQGPLGIDDLYLLDHVAGTVNDPGCAHEDVQRLYDREEFRVPSVVTSFTAASDAPVQVRIASPGFRAAE